MKTAVLCTSIAGLIASVASAADITWQTPLTISGASDVNTSGTVVGTWAPGDDVYNPDSLPVNDVTFNAYGSGPFNSFVSSSGVDDHYTGFAGAGTVDSNYNTILQAAVFSYGSSISLTWGGMTSGNTYLLEFWVNDGRNSVTAERSESLTGGANTSTALTYGTGVSGTGPGQFIIGTFVADVSGQQTITLNAFGGADIGPSAQINLLQLRDVTPVPEPATIALASLGACAMFYGLRRKNRAI